MTRRKRYLIPVVVTLLVTGACGGGSGETTLAIGLKRVALDLAFKTEKPQTKDKTSHAFEPLPVASQLEFAIGGEGRASGGPLGVLSVAAPPCPKAPAQAVPNNPASVEIERVPAAGRYAYRRTGTYEVSGGSVNLKGPMPPTGVVEYRNVVAAPATKDALGRTVEGDITFEIHEATGKDYVTRTLRVTPGAIELTKLMAKTGDSVTSFTPHLPITLMALGSGEGTTWNDTGTDPETGTSMVVQGKTVAREVIDLCGDVYEAFVVQSTERVVNLGPDSAFSSATTDTQNDPATGGSGQPNRYWVATNEGGLFIQEEIHTESQIGTLTLNLDYVSRFDSIAPKKK